MTEKMETVSLMYFVLITHGSDILDLFVQIKHIVPILTLLNFIFLMWLLENVRPSM